MAQRTVGRIRQGNQWWSAFGKKWCGKAGPPVHDDLASRDFMAPMPNALWLGRHSEHCTAWILGVVATA
jgi:putative transposase